MAAALAATALCHAATGATIVLEYGVTGYLGSYDTYVWSQRPATDYSAAPLLFVDLAHTAPAVAGNGPSEALLRFGLDDLLPGGSVITSATLSLYFVDGAKAADLALFEAAIPWTDTSTWSSLGGPPASGPSAVDTRSVDAKSSGAGYFDFSVTSSVAAWQSGSSANLGWVLRNPSRNGARFHSMEAAAGQRPRLTIEYANAPEPVTAILLLLGGIGVTGPLARLR